jgi:hypothetical protein
VEGFVVGATDGVLVARELGEGLAAAVLAEGESEQAGVLVVALLFGGAVGRRGGVTALLVFAHLFHGGDEDPSLQADDAAETPFGGGQLPNLRFLTGFGGLEFGEQTREQGVEFVGVFLGEDGVAGAESVGAGVGADFGFALGGFGAGGELGITTIGFDFQLG